MRSASRHQIRRLAPLAACALLLPGAVAGCATTQDTAALKQAESKRILEAREKRQRRSIASRRGDGKR